MAHSARNRLTVAAIAGATAAGIVLAPAASAAIDGSDLVINEVFAGGAESGSTLTHDFVELYNPTDKAIYLDGWTLQGYGGELATDSGTVELEGAVPAGDFFLVQLGQGRYPGDKDELPTPDLTNENINLGTQHAGIELSNQNDVVDTVGWGTSPIKEGTALGAMSGGGVNYSAERIALGEDTDDNATDFELKREPTPTASSKEIPTNPKDAFQRSSEALSALLGSSR